MKAEIISVGSELLLGQIVDTNASFISRLLPEIGVELYFRSTVGDNSWRLKHTLMQALDRADVVFTIGGIGPTQDDITKETVAEVLGQELVMHGPTRKHLEDFFSKRGVQMPERNLKQAMVPTEGVILENPLGTAPGAVFFGKSDKIVVVLPGPPRELVPMMEAKVVPFLRERMGKQASVIMSRTLRVAGIGESGVEQKIGGLFSGANPTVAPYAKGGEVHLRISAKHASPEEATRLIDEMDSRIIEELGQAVFGRDEETLEKVVVEELVKRHLYLACAESCTGGLIADRITDVPGCSAVFLAGVVSYSNENKEELLGVRKGTLESYGAVSAGVASEMAERVKRISGAHIGVSTTGVAGPSGGSKEKPVGLVYMALADNNGTVVEKQTFLGTRKDIKYRASQHVLDMIRRRLLDTPSEAKWA